MKQMQLTTLGILIYSLVAMTGCEKETLPQPSSLTSKEILFINGNIYTVNEAQKWAEALLVKDGIIQYVGTNAEAENKASHEAEIIDLKNAMMMPGIHDVHMHPLEASTDNFHFEVNTEANHVTQYLDDVYDAVHSQAGKGWLLGWGHDLHTVLDASDSPKSLLDEVSTARPIAIMEASSHSVWCNSKALEILGIGSNTPNPTGGIIMRNASGEANGMLIDNAGNMLIDVALEPTPSRMQNDYEGLVYAALPDLAKHGITSICDARTYWKRKHHQVWQRIAQEGKLTARVSLGLWAYPMEDDEKQIAKLKSLYHNDPTSLLRINQVKLYSDGIVHNTTAAMHRDYKIDLFEESTNNGLNYFSKSRLQHYVEELQGIGFDFHIHAIGNRGISEALDAIAAAGSANARHRLTHLEIVDPADYNRFHQLNVTADCQVTGDFTQPDHWHENEEFIGSTFSSNIIPLKSLKEANARITLSSDWDVSSLNPFVGIQQAITRSPQELGLEEAIEAYTIHAAYVMRQEDKVGSIEVGKEADLVILDRNIFEIAPNRIGKTKVKATYLQGKRVF